MTSVVSSLAVEIGAEIAGLQRGLRRADNSIDDFVTSARRQTMALGAGLTAGVTLPLAGLAVGAARAAMQWESAFAGVRKTVNATETEFAALERGLRDMATGATGSPVAGLENAAVTLAGVAEAAGQLGIAQEHLLEFTETMAMLGMTTNLTAEEAAFSLAQFANITQMPVENIDRLGATIVALGNNSATTERDIVEFAQRLAGAGSSAGLTESEILALGAAMASVGLNAEAGGTAMTQVMTEMTRAAALGGNELEAFAAVAGMTAAQFADTWNAEPMAALDAFIQGLSGMSNAEQVQTLEALGLSGIRVSDTLRRLAGDADLLGSSVELASAAWEENTALLNEAGQRAMTTESQLNMLSNNMREIGVVVATILLPPINQFAAVLIPVLQHVAHLDPAIIQMGVAFAAAAAAAGPLLVVVGALLSPVGLIAGGIAAAAVAIAMFSDEIAAAVPGLGKFGSSLRDNIISTFEGGVAVDTTSVSAWAQDNLESILTAVVSVAGIVLGGPAGMAIGAARLLASAIENDFLGIGTFLNTSGITTAVEGAFNSILASIRGIFTGGAPSGRMVAGGAGTGGGGGLLDGLFAGLTNFTPPDLSAIGALITAAFQPLIDGFTGAWESIQPHLQPFVEGVRGFFDALSQTDTAGLDNIAGVIAGIGGTVFAGLADFVSQLVDLGGSAIGGLLSGLGNALPLVGEGISGIVSAFSIAAETGDVGAALSSLGSGIGNIGSALLGFGAGAADGLIEAIEKVTGLELPDMATIGETLSTGLGALTTAFDNAKLAIDLILQGISTSITDNILTPVSTLWGNVQTAIQPFLEGIQTGIVDPLAALWDNVKAGVEAFWGNITQIFSTINADVIQPIRDAIYEVQMALNALAGGLGAWGSVGDNASAAAGMVTSGQVTPGDFFSALGNAIGMEIGGGAPASPLPVEVGAVPQYATGISYVPGTMLAMLHGGERVLTRDENRAYSQATGGGGAVFNMTLYGTSPHEVAQMVQRAIRDGDR
jgi:TP901 family phage tail tape measure protein